MSCYVAFELLEPLGGVALEGLVPEVEQIFAKVVHSTISILEMVWLLILGYP